jgi:micrococcal nuclease
VLPLDKSKALEKIIDMAHSTSSMPPIPYVFRAKLVRVIDGDTLILDVDQGMHIRRWERIRLLGINCPELVGAQKAAGLEAMGYVQAWIHGTLRIRTEKSDSWGRWLAVCWRESDGANLTDDLIANGHGVAA